MALPWDDDARAYTRDPLDESLRAYGRGSVGRAITPSSTLFAPIAAPQRAVLGGPAAAVGGGGFGVPGSMPVSLATSVRPAPAPLPPVVFPGTPENDQFVKALNNILGGLGGQTRPRPGVQSLAPNSHDEECEAQWDKDILQCKILGAVKGSKSYKICERSANDRYSECLRNGVFGIRTPLYWGNPVN